MKLLLVHIHVYYPSIVPELLGRLENIRGVSFDLFFTISKEVESSELKGRILKRFPSAIIHIVDNRGYDVGPFCHVLNQIDLGNYQYVVKLHTKRNVQEIMATRFFLTGNRWRLKLLRFLESEEVFRKCLQAFESRETLGMVADMQLFKPLYLDCPQSNRNVKALTKRMGIPFSDKHIFVAGTMFIARAKLFIPLQKLHLKIDDFELGRSLDNSSLAHTIERIMGILVYSQGYIIEDCLTSGWIQKWIKLYDRLITFIMKCQMRFL